MFLTFFHSLRNLQVPVSLSEWLTLMEGLAKGLHQQSLVHFYYLARSLLIKDVAYYDAFDQAFHHCFKEIPLVDEETIKKQLFGMVANSDLARRFDGTELESLRYLSFDKLLMHLKQRLAEHHGTVSDWSMRGSGGDSAMGIRGNDPAEISYGAEGEGGRTLTMPTARRFRNLRNDLTLDVRQISVALKRLRRLRDQGSELVLDLDATIDKTCRNGGEIDLIFSPERKNQVRLLLAMDTGGSMEPYRRLCERLFSAAHKLNHFKDFRAFYFHNCIYDKLYSDLENGKSLPTEEVIRTYGKRYQLILVGDAAMSPHELFSTGGTAVSKSPQASTGIETLQQIASAFPKRAWLNPLAPRAWKHFETLSVISTLFPMFPLTITGLEQAVKHLLDIRK